MLLIREGKLGLGYLALQQRTLTSQGKRRWQGDDSKKSLISLSKVT